MCVIYLKNSSIHLNKFAVFLVWRFIVWSLIISGATDIACNDLLFCNILSHYFHYTIHTSHMCVVGIVYFMLNRRERGSFLLNLNNNFLTSPKRIGKKIIIFIKKLNTMSRDRRFQSHNRTICGKSVYMQNWYLIQARLPICIVYPTITLTNIYYKYHIKNELVNQEPLNERVYYTHKTYVPWSEKEEGVKQIL